MIFVPLGTQAMDFSRCLKMLDEMIEHYNIKEKVIVQLGGATYQSKNFEVLPFVPEDNKNAPIDAACPKQIVETSALICCIVS